MTGQRFDFATLDQWAHTMRRTPDTTSPPPIYWEWCRLRRRGSITAKAADRIAVWLGAHPGEIWPDWWHPTDGRNTRPEHSLQPGQCTRCTTTTSRETP